MCVPQYCDHLGPTSEGSVRWYTILHSEGSYIVCACAWAHEPGMDESALFLSLCVVSECYASWCIICTSSLTIQLDHSWMDLFSISLFLYWQHHLLFYYLCLTLPSPFTYYTCLLFTSFGSRLPNPPYLTVVLYRFSFLSTCLSLILIFAARISESLGL